MKTILVTGIGGVVGQGILRNACEFRPDLRIVGTNVLRVTSGNYMCDEVYEVPYSYDEAYIPAIKEICGKENVELIIPSTDYEAYYLSCFQKELGCLVAASPAEVTYFCLDKWRNYEAFSKADIPFAPSMLPSQYDGRFTKCIVKPREGRGSRGIVLNPENPREFDDTNLVQELLEGPEITCTFYVRQDGTLLGFITFQRELESGNTARAEVTKAYDQELNGLIQKILSAFPFRGSSNLQCKVTSRGIIPFEVNCRISGTNSIRAQFGFNDVAFSINELLFGKPLEKPTVTMGSAMRVILDIVYPGKKLNEITNKNDSFYIH